MLSSVKEITMLIMAPKFKRSWLEDVLFYVYAIRKGALT